MGSVKEEGKRNGSVLIAVVVASDGTAVKSAGWSWSPLQGSWWGRVLPPLLEEAHSLAATVGAPEVAAAGGGVAAVPRTVVTIAAPPNTGTPENVDQRRSSETTSSKTSLSLCSCSNVMVLSCRSNWT